MKNPLTPAGIEPATSRFVAQHLKHCATAVHHIYIYIYILFLGWPPRIWKTAKSVGCSPVTGPEGSRKLRFPDFVTTAQDGGRLSALRTGHLYPQEKLLVLILLEAESTPGPYCDRKDFMSMKNPVTLAGIEPATFRSVAQHLNRCATAVPKTYSSKFVYFNAVNFKLFSCKLNEGGNQLKYVWARYSEKYISTVCAAVGTKTS